SQRAERMVGADVRGGAFAPDMLLARRQGKTKGAIPLPIAAQPDQSPRHLAHMRRQCGHEANPRAAELWLDTKTLALANGDIGAELPGRLEHSKGKGFRRCRD